MINKLIRFLKQESIVQFIKFGCVGAFNTVLNLGIYYTLTYFGVHYTIANAIGWFVTVGISYVLNNLLTFNGNGKVIWSFKALVKAYVSYSITGLFLNTFLLWLWIDALGISSTLAPIINMFFTVPINFLLNKYWVYRKRKKETASC